MAATDPALELVDVLDDDGRPVAVMTRGEMRGKRLPHRCVYLLVFNRRGELVIHQRTPTKDVYPSYWDVTVGGVLAAGESVATWAGRSASTWGVCKRSWSKAGAAATVSNRTRCSRRSSLGSATGSRRWRPASGSTGRGWRRARTCSCGWKSKAGRGSRTWDSAT